MSAPRRFVIWASIIPSAVSFLPVSGGTVNCNSAERTSAISEDAYLAPWPDIQGRLFPYMASQMCGETCGGSNNCTYSVALDDIRLRLSMNYPVGGSSPCNPENWNDIFDNCWFQDIPKTGGEWVDGDNRLEMTFEEMPKAPPFSCSIEVGDTQKSEPASFFVSDSVYQPPGTRGGDLPPEYGITVTSFKHNGCDEIGSNLERYITKLVAWTGERQPEKAKFRDEMNDLLMFVLEGSAAALPHRICGLENWFAFYRINSERWIFTDQRDAEGLQRGAPIVYCDEVLGEGSEPEECSVDGVATFEQKKLLACFVVGLPDYCRDFEGNP